MISKTKGVIIAGVIGAFSLVSTGLTSCSEKVRNTKSCQGVICANGGWCDTGICRCPAGYEGPRCANAVVGKYIGPWDLEQEVIGSDSVNDIGKKRSYVVIFKKSATPTTFFIDNFCDSADYNNIICTVDSFNSRTFDIDTTSAYHMMYEHFRILTGGWGEIAPDGSSIKAVLRVKRVNETINWQIDTMSISLKPHQF